MIARFTYGTCVSGCEITPVPREQRGVRAAGAEERAEEREGTGGRAGERAPRGARCAGRRERAQVVRGLAPDEPDGHGEHAERDEQPDRGRAVAELGVRSGVLLGLEREAGRARGALGGVDLRGRERRLGPDEPAGGHLASARTRAAPAS